MDQLKCQVLEDDDILSLLTFLTSLQLFFRLLRSAALLLYYVSSDSLIHISVRDNNVFVEENNAIQMQI